MQTSTGNVMEKSEHYWKQISKVTEGPQSNIKIFIKKGTIKIKM